jgi:hypothetical protein
MSGYNRPNTLDESAIFNLNSGQRVAVIVCNPRTLLNSQLTQITVHWLDWDDFHHFCFSSAHTLIHCLLRLRARKCEQGRANFPPYAPWVSFFFYFITWDRRP